MRRRLLWLTPLLALALPMTAFAFASLRASENLVEFELRCAHDPAEPSDVVLTNEGDAPAQNVEVEVSPAASAGVFPLGGETAEEEIEPGGRMTFSVGFVPVRGGTAEAHAVVRYDAAKPPSEETPSPSPREKRVGVALAGRGLDRFIDSVPRSVFFERVRLGNTAARAVTVYDDGGSPLTIRRIAIEGPEAGDFTVSPRKGTTITEDDPLRLTIGFRPRDVGGRTADLVIESNACGDATFRVPLGGIGVEPEISAEPPEIQFGTQEVGVRSLPKPIKILNVGGAPLQVSSVEIVGDPEGEFFVRRIPPLPETLLYQESIDLDVRFHPIGTGRTRAVLRIGSNDPDDRQLDIRLVGTGGEPNPSPEPTPSGTPGLEPPDDEGPLETVPVATYAPELTVAGAVLGFFLILVILRRLRHIPD